MTSVRCRHGFTLLEMILATLLASLLMMAVLQVMSSITRSAARMSLVQMDDPWHQQARLVLERDLVHAWRCRFADGQLHLEGPLALDHEGRAIHLPAMVTYRIQAASTHDGMTAWVRIQREPDALSRRPPRIDALVWDVRQVAVDATPYATTAPLSPGSDGEDRPRVDLAQWNPVPQTLDIMLHQEEPTSSRGRPDWTWRFHTR